MQYQSGDRHLSGFGVYRDLRRQLRPGEDFLDGILGQPVVSIELEEKLDVSPNEQRMR